MSIVKKDLISVLISRVNIFGDLINFILFYLLFIEN